MHALRSLLAGLVDHAALFPPAALAMSPAVHAHARFRAGDARWMLGRFVVPVARLEELEAAAGDLLPLGDDVEPWRLSALVAPDAAGDLGPELRRTIAFNARHARDAAAGHAVIDAVETRAATPDEVARVGAALAAAASPVPLAAYVEVPLAADPAPLAAAARAAGVRLKARTGGVTADAFPAPDAVVRLLDAAVRAGVPAKLTAGLHHPIAGDHPLTYEPGCATGAMLGFVGVFLAAALLADGHDPAAVAPLLVERDPTTLALGADRLAWTAPDGRTRAADAATVARTRAEVAVAFGSCSFEEPVRELRALGWWPSDSA